MKITYLSHNGHTMEIHRSDCRDLNKFKNLSSNHDIFSTIYVLNGDYKKSFFSDWRDYCDDIASDHNDYPNDLTDKEAMDKYGYDYKFHNCCKEVA